MRRVGNKDDVNERRPGGIGMEWQMTGRDGRQRESELMERNEVGWVGWE